MNPIDLTKKYVLELKSGGMSILQAYLFGSQAKGKTWEGSDIDICLISDYSSSQYEDIKRRMNKLAIKLDTRIEPVLFTPEEFANKYDSLAAEVKQFGIQILPN